MAQNKIVGKAGEDAACEYLEKQGYEIERRNFRTNAGEIDIIAISPDDVCVFVEVKTRKSDRFGRGSEAVDPKKQMKIIKTAMSYRYAESARFDVIEIYYSEVGGFTVREINHIKNAFSAPF